MKEKTKKTLEKLYNDNFISGLFFLGISLFLLIVIPSQIKAKSGMVNSTTMPYIITMILFVAGLILTVKGILGNKVKYFKHSKEEATKIAWYIAYLCIFILYAFLIKLTGFIFSSLLMSCGVLLNYKIKQKKYYALTFAIVFALFFLFKYGLNVNLPSLFL